VLVKKTLSVLKKSNNNIEKNNTKDPAKQKTSERTVRLMASVSFRGIKVEISYFPATDTPKMDVKAKKIANRPKSSGLKILAKTGLIAKGINCDINEPTDSVETALKKEFCKILGISYW
jgi:hypothetical protein